VGLEASPANRLRHRWMENSPFLRLSTFPRIEGFSSVTSLNKDGAFFTPLQAQFERSLICQLLRVVFPDFTRPPPLGRWFNGRYSDKALTRVFLPPFLSTRVTSPLHSFFRRDLLTYLAGIFYVEDEVLRA